MTEQPDWRQQRRQAAIQAIKNAARQQIAENGAGNFSLGAVARALGMTPPALYRYFANRDALVASLIVDAYGSMGQALEHAAVEAFHGDHTDRFMAFMRAYRQWAVEFPENFSLMYGLPTSDVEMPPEQLQAFQGAALRSMRAMVDVLYAAYQDGCLSIPGPYHDPPPAVRSALSWMHTVLEDPAIPLGILALAFATWIRAEGLIWQELHGHLPRALFGTGEFYEMECAALADRLGLNQKKE
jgi:AcrR family transcriptional regulator